MAKRALRSGKTIFSLQEHLDLTGGNGGGYFKGYELINGTNSGVGDFELNGTIYTTDTPDLYRVEAEYVIHDIMDPEFGYGFWEYAGYAYSKLSTLFLGGKDYELEIRGTISYYVTWAP